MDAWSFGQNFTKFISIRSKSSFCATILEVSVAALLSNGLIMLLFPLAISVKVTSIGRPERASSSAHVRTCLNLFMEKYKREDDDRRYRPLNCLINIDNNLEALFSLNKSIKMSVLES